MVTRRYIIRGQVQGVGFRWFVLKEARQQGIAGWVRNQPDGSVEVLAAGHPEALDAFEVSLGKGPRHAVVHEVVRSEEPAAPGLMDFMGFEVR